MASIAWRFVPQTAIEHWCAPSVGKTRTSKGEGGTWFGSEHTDAVHGAARFALRRFHGQSTEVWTPPEEPVFKELKIGFVFDKIARFERRIRAGVADASDLNGYSAEERWMTICETSADALESWSQTAMDRQPALAHVAAARACIDRGWAVRGSGRSETVHPQAWDVFHDHLRSAEHHAFRAVIADPTDPLPFVVLTITARALGIPVEQRVTRIREAAERGVTLALAMQAAVTLGPMWGGSVAGARAMLTEFDRVLEPGSPARIAYLTLLNEATNANVSMNASKLLLEEHLVAANARTPDTPIDLVVLCRALDAAVRHKHRLASELAHKIGKNRIGRQLTDEEYAQHSRVASTGVGA
jgi:hypothetical protein